MAFSKSDSPLTPLGEAIRRLREKSGRPHMKTGPFDLYIAVRAMDVELVLDALHEAERVIPWDRGGES